VNGGRRVDELLVDPPAARTTTTTAGGDLASIGVLVGCAVVVTSCLLPWARVGATWRSGFRFANLLLDLPDLGVGAFGPGSAGLLWYSIPIGAVVASCTLLVRKPIGSGPATVAVLVSVVVVTVLEGTWMALAGVSAIGPGPFVAGAAGTVSAFAGVLGMRAAAGGA
jgi:hypothetical protein